MNDTNDLTNDLSLLSMNGSTPKSGGDSKTPSTESNHKNRSKSHRKKRQQTPKDKPIVLSDIIGYERQLNALREVIELPLLKSSEIRQMGVQWPRSALLYGPTGTGKSLAVKAFCNQFMQKMFCLHINCATILAKSFATSETNLKTIFLLRLFFSKKHIVVIAITNKPDLIDTSLRRPRRLDREIEFPVPMPTERTAILRKHLNETNSDISDEVLSGLAQSAHSFTGADLVLSCGEAALIALKDNNRLVITEKDLKQALKSIRPSAMREISLEVPNVFWSDIGGMHSVRNKLTQSVVWPLTNPEAFERLDIKAPKGVLMYGPPGCCKTMIGKALATESGLNFLAIKGPELFNKWVGESERAVREVFRKAKAASPSILFFDEIDALAAERGNANTVGDKVLAQLLTEIDGIEQLNGVVIVAATNRPDMIDKALLRPGRLDSILYVALPDLETRYEILRIRTRRMPVKFEQPLEEVLKDLSVRTEGYTGAEITGVCQEAGLIALTADINCKFVELNHFESALESIKPRISHEMISFYETYKNETTNYLNVKK
ncbi:unnamed protein product [Oppiella nova]|uniref:AAA+ ATPase domain-containing protein n=1 Tax=Oppiella nova TaxID=334625 RepID=A0A7R9LAU0_9ACAR|nr:unnamed protein product [Oppiella nova]CAG2161628.1 unnamed protein product [Oppiella nova]